MVVNIASRQRRPLSASALTANLGQVNSRSTSSTISSTPAKERPGLLRKPRVLARPMATIMDWRILPISTSNRRQPWVVAKQEGEDEQLRPSAPSAEHVSPAMTYLAPVLAKNRRRPRIFPNAPAWTGTTAPSCCKDHGINKFNR